MNRVAWEIIGFVVGSGLAFLAVALALSDIGAEDVKQYLQLYFGLPAGLFGGMIGAAIGAAIGTVINERAGAGSPADRLDERPPRKHLCPNCGRQPTPGSKTCRWCGADQV